MTLFKNRFIRFAVVLLVVVLSFARMAPAEKKTFVKEYTYHASDIDSKVTSRSIALEQVKRMLLEELGTYLIAETEAKNFQLTKDKVTVLTAGTVRTEILAEKWDGLTYYLKAGSSRTRRKWPGSSRVRVRTTRRAANRKTRTGKWMRRSGRSNSCRTKLRPASAWRADRANI